jgi:IS5 family transposase
MSFERSSLTRWRQRLGEDTWRPCCRRACRSPIRRERYRPKDLERVAVDTTVQPKAVAHPTDARLKAAWPRSGPPNAIRAM